MGETSGRSLDHIWATSLLIYSKKQKMLYNQKEILSLIEKMEESSTDKEKIHLTQLRNLVANMSSARDIFLYGVQFLPKIILSDGKVDLNLLENYSPDIRPFFDILSEVVSLPKNVSDLATDLALYANGSSVELDNEICSMNPAEKVMEVFGAN